MSASRDRLCLKYVMEEEQILPNKIETDLKMDLKITGYKNDMEKDTTLDI